MEYLKALSSQKNLWLNQLGLDTLSDAWFADTGLST
jgi:hypothetical protein